MFNIKQRSELTQRIVTGLLGGLLILFSIYLGQWTYFAVFFFICMFTMVEFYRLLGLDGNLPLKTVGTLIGLSLYTIIFLIEQGAANINILFLVFIAFTLVYTIKLYVKKDEKPFVNIALTFLGIIYVALPFSLMHFAVFFDAEYHYEVILGSLLLIWASDTGAYFSGRTFGKHKLFERISPKKTWEGSIGGLLFSVLISIGLSYCFDIIDFWHWVAISIIIVVSGTYGDLVESLFKRSMSIKDSSSVLPGHGGFLDRFDSLLLAAPSIAAFLKLLPPK